MAAEWDIPTLFNSITESRKRLYWAGMSAVTKQNGHDIIIMLYIT